MSGYTQYRVEIGGDLMIMHNGQTANPLNHFAKALKEIATDKQRKKTEEGILAMGAIELEAGLYLDAKGRVILPSRILEAAIAEGARKTKEGKTALAGMFVDSDGVLEYAGGPLTVKQLVESPDHRLAVPVAVAQSKVIRVRPMFKDWQTQFNVSVLDELVTAKMLETWLTNTGSFVGIGDWRPRYGRFEIKALAPVKSKRAA